MKQFTIYDANGNYLRNGMCSAEDYTTQAGPTEQIFEGCFFPDQYCLVNGVPTTKPTQPTPFHDWDKATHTWIANLQQAKEAKKLEITLERNTRLVTPVTYDNKLLDGDEDAKRRIVQKLLEISTATLLEENPSPMFWRDANNNIHTWTDVPTFTLWLQGLVIVLGVRETAVMAASWVHKDAIDALTTVEEVINYNYSTGWSV